ncbi:MAG TPA: TolC family protein [Verrucomicrobiae bacterium]|nr:TolC family protein [Verrucomicrobiae bacterium]
MPVRFPGFFSACLAVALAATAASARAQAQNPVTNAPSKLPAATPATTNLFTTNILTGPNLFANTNGVIRALGLIEAIRSAVSNNFDVRIERIEPQIAETDIQAAKGAYDPVISASGEHRDTKIDGAHTRQESVGLGLDGRLPTGATYSLGVDTRENASRKIFTNDFTRSGSGSATVISARQPLLRNMWIDQFRYQIQISRKQLKISELGFRLRLLSTVSLVEQAYFDWIAARENVRVQEEAVTLARQQAREYGVRAQIGTARPLDQQRFESQAASSEATLLQARRNLKAQENTLINLITTEFEAWHGFAIEPADQLPTIDRPYDLQESWTKAFERRPDLHQLVINLEQLGLTEKLRYNQIFPQLDLTGMYGYNGSAGSLGDVYVDLADANKPTWAVGLEASFPIGNRTARANLRAIRLQKEQADERLKQSRQTIMVQVENAINDARTGWARIPATRAAREYAAAALRAGQLQLQQGAVTPLELLTLQQDLTAARSDEIRALVDYNKAVTVLLEREGTLLDERGLTLSIH